MELALEEPEQDEITFEDDGVKFAVARWAEPYAEAATVDYVEGEGAEGFTVTADSKWFQICDDDDW